MLRILNMGWLTLAVLALLVALYVTIDEGFVFGKAYMFLLLALVSYLLFRYKKNA